MEKLYRFNWDCGIGGDVEGMFIATEDEVGSAMDKDVYFGEILGKHSEVYGVLEEHDLEVLDVSDTTVQELKKVLGRSISGYNPLEYIKY
ncbi:hypothetical protein IR151_17255 [Clostridioides sp. ES-S-0006-03]|uniref:hypothetical protein n=1 Tax=Clostridioides sp. ES-S-0006-03 TaxID=2770775 RepID=UPI001D0C0E24|nr:hypothetical protein [Clostridioides sp. ES-S-0006-03]